MLSLLRPTRIILIVLLAAAFFGWRYWDGLHHSNSVGQDTALASFRKAPGGGAVPGMPLPGVYTYRQSGSEHAGLGPAGLDRTLPSSAQLVVRRISGGYEEERLLSGDHVEGARYRLTADGRRLTWVRTKLSFGVYDRDDARSTNPDPLTMPRRPRAGQTWTERYRTGNLPVVAVSRVLRSESLPVDGLAVPVLVVETHTITAGAHPGDQRETVWWSPARALVIRSALTRRVRGVVSLDVTANLELEHLRPKT